ncbi:bifunctional folylpolyglutamate synthase/dihydrofolate synthase [Levilactobacillus bambusae]|uniref:Dihydrofolate synthase/folylpolyglutamate synthase n=1 Tax=Levilactobacillus bambusae TaxID=2024736 RepID=A0A2V1MXJ9_9LACO|nr:folylpolyglutamate synthase/dihydrofolate synthase family protein [Levilactobacillus bambusae]PWF99561.1 bifunctional folylpolyglutamate synthase/dihydrofolate synthase [Levilactobacillus bambusae]
MVENYEEALAFIHGRTQFKKIPTLDRMEQLMAALGHPERQLSVIHVAGTNGKGSTVAYLRELLMTSGLTVGTFTSPYITRFNERISIDDVPISDDDLIQLVNRVQPVVKRLDHELTSGGPTEFEIITAMMFVYFANIQVDVAVVEVGIGGKFDSTNVVTPDVSVITTIGMDHMKLLGNTIEAIADQKAGIIKPQVPVVTGRLTEPALAVISRVADQQEAKWFAFDRDFRYQPLRRKGWGEQFNFENGVARWPQLTIPLLGSYQMDNASVALQAYYVYQSSRHVKMKVADVKNGLLQTTWPGRFEKLNESPLVVIDGAHNEPAIIELAHLIKTHFATQEVWLILAILADKQVSQMVKTLGKLPNVHLILTRFEGPGNRQAASEITLEDAVPDGVRAQISPNWQSAILLAINEMSADDLLLITGSLYFISDVRHYFLVADQD